MRIVRSGIYAIVNTTNGKRYVGSTVDLRKRKLSHWSALKRNTHGNLHLQAAWNKYGKECFQFVIVAYVPRELLLDVEQKHLDASSNGYNIAQFAYASARGTHRSEKAKAKQSAAMKGIVVPNEKRARISATLMGHSVSEETRAKISAANKGKNKGKKRKVPMSEATRAKIGAASRGRPCSEETRAKMSAAVKGRKLPPHTPEAKAKISAAQKGKPWSAARRAAWRLAWRLKSKKVKVV